jgi:hypothetical protein
MGRQRSGGGFALAEVLWGLTCQSLPTAGGAADLRWFLRWVGALNGGRRAKWQPLGTPPTAISQHDLAPLPEPLETLRPQP